MYRTVIMYNKNITTIFPELLRETELVKTVEEIFSDGTFLDFKRIPSLNPIPAGGGVNLTPPVVFFT